MSSLLVLPVIICRRYSVYRIFIVDGGADVLSKSISINDVLGTLAGNSQCFFISILNLTLG